MGKSAQGRMVEGARRQKCHFVIADSGLFVKSTIF